jgi:hypothetical protein
MVIFIAGAVVSTFSCFVFPLFGGGLRGLLIFVVQIVALVKTLQGEFWKILGAWGLASRVNL